MSTTYAPQHPTSKTRIAEDLTEVIHRSADHLGTHGWLQHRVEDEDGRVCVSGAVRASATTSTDQSLTLAVLRAREHGEEWNDAPGRTADEVRTYLTREAVTDADLTSLFGPALPQIRDLLLRAEALTPGERQRLSPPHDGHPDLWVARHVAMDLTATHNRAAVAHLELPPLGEVISGGVGDALWALATRDLIGHDGYTRPDYALLTRAWVSVAGPAHPEDTLGGSPR